MNGENHPSHRSISCHLLATGHDQLPFGKKFGVLVDKEINKVVTQLQLKQLSTPNDHDVPWMEGDYKIQWVAGLVIAQQYSNYF